MDGRELEVATMRKVSRRLIPYLFVLYVAAYLDRINIGFAQLQMKSALGFSDTVYGLGAGIFFLGYFLFEVPSNLILARIGARVWIARIMITWGLISSAMAIVRTPAEFYALRFLLGVAEAGFFPGVIYYLSQWFPAAARASAISRFMTATAVSGIVGGPLSAALFTLDGMSGLAGWQWIFVAEGIPSVLLGVTTLWFLTDRPAEAKWLSPAEREYLDATMRAEAADIVRRGHVSLRRALFHPTVWWLSLLSFTLLVGFYGISFWLPQIVQSFSASETTSKWRCSRRFLTWLRRWRWSWLEHTPTARGSGVCTSQVRRSSGRQGLPRPPRFTLQYQASSHCPSQRWACSARSPSSGRCPRRS